MKAITTAIFSFLLCTGLSNMGNAQEDYPYYKEDWEEDIDQGVQEEQVKKEEKVQYDEPSSLKGSINVGLGYINPSEINSYIYADLQNQGISLVDGTSDMTMALIIGAQLYYVVTPKFQPKAIFDYAIGISSTQVINQSEYITYTASRISVGAGANYYFGQKRFIPYAGAAILLHALRFEGFKASTVAPRIEGGAAFNFSQKFKLEAFLQLDTAEAEAKKLRSQSITIDMSSINAGARFLVSLD